MIPGKKLKVVIFALAYAFKANSEGVSFLCWPADGSVSQGMEGGWLDQSCRKAPGTVTACQSDSDEDLQVLKYFKSCKKPWRKKKPTLPTTNV